MNTDEPECGWVAKVAALEAALQAQTESSLHFKRLAAKPDGTAIARYMTQAEIDADKSRIGSTSPDDVRSALADKTKWPEDKLTKWARGWHWDDCAEEHKDSSIYSRDIRMLKAFEAALRSAPVSGFAREAIAEACIRRLALCNINNPDQRDMAADDIRSTLQKIEAASVPDATVSEPVAWGSDDVAYATADIWRAYCAETREKERSLQGALAFGVAFVLWGPPPPPPNT